jgi:hypothetical protein
MAPCGARADDRLEQRQGAASSSALHTIIALTRRLKLARLFLWLARVTDTYDGVAMSISRRVVESAECCAIKAGLTTAPSDHAGRP